MNIVRLAAGLALPLMNPRRRLTTISGFILLLGSSTAPGQLPLFSEVQPVYSQGNWERFPALQDLRAAWGDMDADGDLDLVITGGSPSGPVTKFYESAPSEAFPFAFAERSTLLPWLQDGALAWGDMDNDGDLDLAMSGSVRTQPTGQTDLRAYVFRNDSTPGNWHFTNVSANMGLQAGYGGCASWADKDNDGDQDLFMSGLMFASPSGQTFAFARVYENTGGSLRPVEAQRFLSYKGANAQRRWERGQPSGRDTVSHPERLDVDEIRRVTWVDVNKDSYPDMVVSSVEVIDPVVDGPFPELGQDIWVNTGPVGGGIFERWGDERSITPNPAFVPTYPPGLPPQWPPESERYLFHDLDPLLEPSPAPDVVPPAILTDFYRQRTGGGVGDWDGDGWTDLAFTAVMANSHAVLHRFTSGTGLPEDILPGFSTQVSMEPASEYVSVQTSADFMNTGRQQWLCGRSQSALLPVFRLLIDDGNSGLGEFTAGQILNLEETLCGVLEPADINSDGRLDLLQSGFDNTAEVKTRFYRNQHVTANTPPAAPGGLTADVTPTHMRFSWNPSSDAQTPAQALRYVVKLYRGDQYLIRPNATDAGKRLMPGLNGTLQTTWFEYDAGAGGHGVPLTDGTYHWTVQAVDSGGMGSAFAPEQEFKIGFNGTFAEVPQSIPFRDASIDLADFDNDGDLDTILAGGNGTGVMNGEPTAIWRRIGGDFTPGPALPPIRQGMARWGDMDGDGDPDLAISGESNGQPLTQIFRNEAGVLRRMHLLEGVKQSALDWGDFDNDGDLDLIVTGYSSRRPVTRLYRNGGAANNRPNVFEVVGTTLRDTGSGAVAWGDFDHDGDADLLLCGDTANYDVTVPPVTAPPYDQRPPNTYYVAGVPTVPLPRPVTILYRNDGLNLFGINAGKWQFTELPARLPPVLGSFSLGGGTALTARVEWFDLTDDGYPELVMGGMTPVPAYPAYAYPMVRVLRNAGPGGLGQWNFHAGGNLLGGSLSRALQTLTCADWDQDGRADVLLSGRLNDPGAVPTQIVHNKNMRFAERSYLRSLDDGVEQFASGPAAFGHFDGDAKVDVLLSGMWGLRTTAPGSNWGTVGSLFLNRAEDDNLPPSAPTGLSATIQGPNVLLSWQPCSDDNTLSFNLTYDLSVVRADGQPGGMPATAGGRQGNAGYHTSWTLRSMPAGTYRWSVRAIDSALAPSAFTVAAQTFTVGPPPLPIITPLPPLHVWLNGNPALTSVHLKAVAAGRSARLVAGRRGRLYFSREGGPFIEVESGVFTDLFDVIIDAAGAMVVGEAGIIRISDDGVIWRESPSGTASTLRAVVRGNTGWVAAGENVILHSTDRLTWTSGTMPAGTIIHDVVWGQGRYIAAGERAAASVLLTSTDGLAWSEVTPAGLAPGALSSVATDGTKFVAVGGYAPWPGTHSDVLTSTNGLTWTFTQTADEVPPLKIIHTPEGWFAVKNHLVMQSADAQTWEVIRYAASFNADRYSDVAVADGLITATGDAGILFDSPVNGVSPGSWTRRGGSAEITYNSPMFLAALGSVVVAGTAIGPQHLSRDGGRTWARNGSYFNRLDAITSGNGLFVRSGGNGLDSSADGSTWISADEPSGRNVIFGGGVFLASRFSIGGFLRSADGRTWSTTGASVPESVDIAHGLGMFMALDVNGEVRVSADAFVWSLPVHTGAQRLAFAHDRFFAMSDSGDVRTSADGVTWTPVTGIGVLNGVVLHDVIWHDGRFVALGGEDAVLLVSPDAVTWVRIPIPTSGTLYRALSTPEGLIIAGTEQALLFAPDLTPPPAPEPALHFLGNPAACVFTFAVTGRAGQLVTFEQSVDLLVWTAVESFTCSGGTEILEVECTNLLPKSYFRLRWGP